MVYCAAYGCNNQHKKGCGKSFFTFPKEAGRRRAWEIFCRRSYFKPTENHRLCSDHFSKAQLERDPHRLGQYGYEGARIRLKRDAVPDVPLDLPSSASAAKPAKPRGAFLKRQEAEKAEVLRKTLQKFEPDTLEHVDIDSIPDSETAAGQEAATEVLLDHETAEQSAKSTTTINKVTATKICQASLQIPQRTRRIQVSLDKKNTKTESKGIQCSSLNDGIPLRVAAGLATIPQLQCESDSDDSDIEFNACDDPDYDCLDDDETDSVSDSDDNELVEDYALRTGLPPEEERQFLVSEGQLAKLLQKCKDCGSICSATVTDTRGSMIRTTSECSNSHVNQWESQQSHNIMPWTNLFITGAIMFSGCNASKTLRLFKHLKVQMISMSTFSRLQSAYVVPSVIFTWDFHQETLLNDFQGKRLTLGGDARCDSPGHTAKFGSYTLMELETGKILDFQLVQSNEVASSIHMELEGLKRGLQHLNDSNIIIEDLVTDRHGMVKKFMREDHPEVNHYFDVWHVAKGISKKLEAASKKKDCQNIRPWIKSSVNHCYWTAASCGDDGIQKQLKWCSLGQHVSNTHINCEHGVLNEEKLWLREGSRAHKLFKDVVENPFLLRDVAKLSPLHQTYGLEVFHSVVNTFAPKNTHFFYPAMMARLCVAALHFNENGRRHQATTKAGEDRWQISYPKGKKGAQAVVKPSRQPVTYDYINLLMLNLCERRRQHPSITLSVDEAHQTFGYCPPSLTSGYTTFVKEDLVATRRTRFGDGRPT